jgi:hypothetical protein
LYDQQSYYLLGFDPEDEKFDQRYHSIKVNVTRPGVKVRTRSGFFGVDDSVREKEREEQPRTRGQQILSALLAPFGANALSLRMTPYFFNSASEGPLVRALFHIDCSRLKFKDIELSTGADAKRFDYVGRLRLNDFPPGEYLLRLVVTDGLAIKKYRHAEQWMDFIVK